jgi:isoleucyl-tRNA synthetase
VNEFVTLDLSAYYLDILKDRLYTAAPNSRLRRSSQTAICRIVEALTRAMAPLYSFTCDEIWQYLPKEAGREESVHMALFVPAERLIEGFSEKMLQKLDDWDKQLAPQVVSEIRARHAEAEVMLISLSLQAIEQFRSLAPEISSGYLSSVSVGSLEGLPVKALAQSRLMATAE